MFQKQMKGAENFVSAATVRVIGLEEICYCEAASALIRYKYPSKKMNRNINIFLSASSVKTQSVSLLKENCVGCKKKHTHTCFFAAKTAAKKHQQKKIL